MTPVDYVILLAILIAGFLAFVGGILAWRNWKVQIKKKLYDILSVVGGYENHN